MPWFSSPRWIEFKWNQDTLNPDHHISTSLMATILQFVVPAVENPARELLKWGHGGKWGPNKLEPISEIVCHLLCNCVLCCAALHCAGVRSSPYLALLVRPGLASALAAAVYHGALLSWVLPSEEPFWGFKLFFPFEPSRALSGSFPSRSQWLSIQLTVWLVFLF